MCEWHSSKQSGKQLFVEYLKVKGLVIFLSNDCDFFQLD